MIWVPRPQPYARSIVEPQTSARLLPLRDLQPFATPDTLYPVLANLPALSLQQRRDTTVAIAPILSGKIGDGPGERVFNQIDTVIDIGPYVKTGNNTVEVEVATTLNNKLRKL